MADVKATAVESVVVGAAVLVGAMEVGMAWPASTGLDDGPAVVDGFTRLVAEMATETVVEAWAEPAGGRAAEADAPWWLPCEREHDQPDEHAHDHRRHQHQDQDLLRAIAAADAAPARPVRSGTACPLGPVSSSTVLVLIGHPPRRSVLHTPTARPAASYVVLAALAAPPSWTSGSLRSR